MKFNQKVVDSLELPAGKNAVIFWDSACPGLGARLQGDARRWVIRYRVAGDPKQRQVTLGPITGIPLRRARELAAGYITAAKRGTDYAADLKADAAEAQRQRTTREEGQLKAIFERYLVHAESELRPSTLRDLRRYLRVLWAPIHYELAADLDRRAIITRLENIATDNGAITANRARSALSQAMSWAVRRGIIEVNPVIGVAAVRSERPRDRVLTSDEILKLWAETDREGDYAKIIRLLHLMGQRREEVAGMRWSEIDLERRLWEIPGGRTKNHRPHQVPLADQVVSILETLPRAEGRDLVFGRGAGGFNGFGKCKERSDRRSGLRDWRIHDLRRTAVTGMAELGIQPHVIEAVVNHISGHKGGVAGIYNRATYADEKRAALQRWADHVSRLVGEGTDATVVALPLAR